MEEKIITKENLIKLASELVEKGYNVITPSARGYVKHYINDNFEISSEAAPGKSSFKEYVFPKTEPLFYYKKNKEDASIIDAELKNVKNVIIGAKPCDAKSISILNKVFNWDYKDEFFNIRANNTIVFGIVCSYHNEFCFCTSVGISPVSDEGSDVFIVPLDKENFAVKIITERGKAFMKDYEKYLKEGNPEKSKAVIDAVKIPGKSFDSEQVREWITNNFENEYWNEPGKLCLGCAQCAFVCPVCHCFDIVDEDINYFEGRRMKNWDGCQFGHFTLHASGHNPREKQDKRYRQRVSHKFKYYKDKFDEILCTGCGRCSRGCPVSIDIKEIVTTINELSSKHQEIA